MRKAKDSAGGHDKEVRFPIAITIEERFRLRAVAALLRRPMEDVAGDWVREKLAGEEKRLGIPRSR